MRIYTLPWRSVEAHIGIDRQVTFGIRSAFLGKKTSWIVHGFFVVKPSAVMRAVGCTRIF